MGVGLVVGGYRPSQQRTNAGTGTVDLCFCMRGKRAVALTPKRELLIETDKAIETRKLKSPQATRLALKSWTSKKSYASGQATSINNAAVQAEFHHGVTAPNFYF